MVTASRTVGPLHFEDLEPKRFEDLARQLIYDFKPWRRLEATGRAGSDDGFDARGYEMVDDERPSGTSDETEEPTIVGTDDRLWLVQCKRERAIGPTKLAAYLDDIRLGEGERLYGIVFTAACDFSKAARDKFRQRCDALGIQEWHLWGKTELEDKLLRPENDGLLFAYFGVSLTIRRRSQRADLRARLVMKRKANRVLEVVHNAHVLLRSPDAIGYPYSKLIPDFATRPPWLVRPYRGLRHDGVLICLYRHFAYLSDDGSSWDAAMAVNEAIGHPHDDPWNKDRHDALRQEAWNAWNALPESNRAWFEVLGIIPFEEIIDIDELGDEYVRAPHIYVPFSGNGGPFKGFTAEVSTTQSYDARSLHLANPTENRIVQFPAHLRERDKPAG